MSGVRLQAEFHVATPGSSLSFRTEMNFAYEVPAQMAGGIVRIVAENPGPFTYHGTNTYVVGGDELAVIDPGPDLPAHRQAILRYAEGRPVRYILVTHTHRDHVDGLPALAEQTGATVCGFGRAGLEQDPRIKSMTGRAYIDVDFEPDRTLTNGETIDVSGLTLTTIHTPGHAPDHLCFEVADRRIVFSGDHVMGWNTTVVAPPEGHMGDYLASLERLAACDAAVFLPGHGGRIPDPVRFSRAYLVHRRLREQAIMDAVRRGHDTIDAIVALIYQQLEPTLITAAKMSVMAHVEHLIEKDVLSAQQPLDFSAKLSPEART